MASAQENSADGKLDLVPMIDCVMLLLLYFILTTSFSSPEKVIASLLPTTKGDGSSASTVVPPATISLCIYPAGFARGFSAREYQDQLTARGSEVLSGKAWLRIGNREPLEIDGALLRVEVVPGQAQPVNPEMERIDAYVAQALNDYEKTGGRSDQDPITVASFSGMSWKFALVAYDAVRAYEATRVGAAAVEKKPGTEPVAMSPEQMRLAREVDFLPPPLRGSGPRELGEEMAEILRR